MGLNVSSAVASMTTDSVTIDLSGMGEKPSGAWEPGWYPAEIIEGYTAGDHEFRTEVTTSREGDSFNFLICFRIQRDDKFRTIFRQINYRPLDFNSETIEAVQRLRKVYEGQNKWAPEHKTMQRSSLALSQLGQLQDATGAPLSVTPLGTVEAYPFLGKRLFVRLTINDKGYNDINAFSKYPNGNEPRKKGKKQSS